VASGRSGGLRCCCSCACGTDLVPWLGGPAPYPPEWQWRYRPHALAKAARRFRSARPRGPARVVRLPRSRGGRPRGAAAALIIGGGLLGSPGRWPCAERRRRRGGVLVSRTMSAGLLLVSTRRSSDAAQDLRTCLRDTRSGFRHSPNTPPSHRAGPIFIYSGLISAFRRGPRSRPVPRRVEAACGADGGACSEGRDAATPVERSAALAGGASRHAAAVLGPASDRLARLRADARSPSPRPAPPRSGRPAPASRLFHPPSSTRCWRCPPSAASCPAWPVRRAHLDRARLALLAVSWRAIAAAAVVGAPVLRSSGQPAPVIAGLPATCSSARACCRALAPPRGPCLHRRQPPSPCFGSEERDPCGPR